MLPRGPRSLFRRFLPGVLLLVLVGLQLGPLAQDLWLPQPGRQAARAAALDGAQPRIIRPQSDDVAPVPLQSGAAPDSLTPMRGAGEPAAPPSPWASGIPPESGGLVTQYADRPTEVPLAADDPRGLPDALVGMMELAHLRTIDSATFDMGDGTYARVQDARAMHYQDIQGNWQPIDPTFVAVEDGWINSANSLFVGLSPRNSNAKIGVADVGVGWETLSLVAIGAGGQTFTLATVVPEAEGASSQPSADGRAVHYTGNWSDPALQDQWRSGLGIAEYTMRLPSLPQLPSRRSLGGPSTGPAPAGDSLELHAYLHLRPGTTLQAGGEPVTPDVLPLGTDGALSFVSAGGDAVWLQPPQAHEQDDPSVRVAGSYRLAATADPATVELSARVPWDWLAAEGRRFPVVIDPLFQMRFGTVVRAAGYREGGDFARYYEPGVGRFRDTVHDESVLVRLFARFATPHLPPDTEIIQAYLIAVPTGGGATTKLNFVSMPVRAHEIEWGNPESSAAPQYTISGTIGTEQMGYSPGAATTPVRGAVWDVTEQVMGWVGDPFGDHGIMLEGANGFCDPTPAGCGGLAFDETLVWTDVQVVTDVVQIDEDRDGQWDVTPDELRLIEEFSTPGDPARLETAHGGVRLMVYYSGPELDVDEVVGGGGFGVNWGLPDGDDPYFHADHEYRVTAGHDEHWYAVVARGIGVTEGSYPPHAGEQVFTQHLSGSMPLDLRTPTGDHLLLGAKPNDHLTYALLNARVGLDKEYRVRVKARVSDGLPLDYDIRMIDEAAEITPVLSDTVVVTTPVGFDSNEPLAVWNIKFGVLPQGSNARVVVEIYSSTVGAAYQGFEYLYDHVESFSAQMYKGESEYFVGYGDHIKLTNDAKCSTEYGDVGLSSPIFAPDTTPGDYALALAYNGPGVNLWIATPPPRIAGRAASPQDSVEPLVFGYRVRVTACPVGTFPTKSDTCQTIQCPSGSDQVLDTYREHGDFGLWSKDGWDVSGPPWQSEGVNFAPMLGDTGAAPSVAVVGGQISYSGAETVVLSEESQLVLVNCNTLITPTSPVEQEDYFPVYDGSMWKLTGNRLTTLGCGIPKFDPWRPEDANETVGDVTDTWFEVRPLTAEAHGGGDLRRRVGPDGTIVHFFDVSYWVDVGGWPSLGSTVIRTDTNTPPTIASLRLAFGDTFSLDVEAPGDDKDDAREFQHVRNSDATISQPPELGGATKPVQALILGVGMGLPPKNEERSCPTQSCIDVRALDDAYPDAENRNWQMPDVHTNVQAGMVTVSTAGMLRVFSVDHPAAAHAPQDIDQSFSFDTFGASVKVGYEKCVPKDEFEVLVVRGETQLEMPNIGAVAAGFKLCESTLRQVHFEFYSPVGIPLANTGLFLTGLSGSVDIFPAWTEINFGLNFQTGDGGYLFSGYGGVTIDTRGLFAFQGSGELLGLVDVDGSLWVAWDPLDVGFSMDLVFDLTSEVGLTGSVWAHMWEGQGWQHRYHWLPDNDEKHMAASISAEFHIDAGAAFSWWFIDIPPFDFSIGVEVAFGEFCTNASCSSYEWGIKGKFVIVGYDIGLYFGFDHGIDFILGNDDHVLIDQFGGGGAPFQPRGSADGVAARAASLAVNGVSTETLSVSADAEQLLVALGWETGSPTLTLYDKYGADVEGSPNYTVTTYVTTTSKLIGVQIHSPEVGDWHAVIGNLAGTGEEHYKFIYFANKGAPGTEANPGSFVTPGPGLHDGTGVYTITWDVPADTPVTATISLYHTRYYAIGAELFTDPEVVQDVPIVKNLPFTAGSYLWDTSGLKNYAITQIIPGEENLYRIRAVVDDGVNDFPAGSVFDPADPCQPRGELHGSRAFDAGRFPGLTTFSSEGFVVVTDTVAPGTPTGLELEGVDGAILARWDASPEKDLAYYLVRWGIRMPETPTSWFWYNEELVSAVVSPTVRLGGLDGVKEHHVTVKGLDTNGNESAFSPIEAATPTSADTDPVPHAPISLTVTSQTDTYVRFSWSPAATGAVPDSYQLVYKWVMGPYAVPYSETVGYVDPASPPTDVTGLQTGGTYRVIVSAANSDSWRSARSQPVTVTVTRSDDADSDGLPDDWATAFGVYSYTLDADLDGLENGEELALGTDPTVQDSDGDEFSDWEEREQGTDPLDRTSFPAE